MVAEAKKIWKYLVIFSKLKPLVFVFHSLFNGRYLLSEEFTSDCNRNGITMRQKQVEYDYNPKLFAYLLFLTSEPFTVIFLYLRKRFKLQNLTRKETTYPILT